jgi:hypothetical protein
VRFRSFFAFLLVFVLDYSASAQGVPSQGTVWLYRSPSDYSGMGLTLYMDGKKLVSLPSGRFFGVQVPFGSHKFFWTRPSNARQVVVPVEPDQPAYFEVSFGSREPFLSISPRPAEEALVQMSILQALDSTYVFDFARMVPPSNLPKPLPIEVVIESAKALQPEPAGVPTPETAPIPAPPAPIEVQVIDPLPVVDFTGNAGSELTFTIEQLREGTEVEVKGIDEKEEPQPEPIKIDQEQFEKLKQTATLADAPAGIEKTSEGWTGVFFVDGERIKVTPETKMLVKLTGSRKEAAKAEESASDFRPLASLEEIMPGMSMTYEGKRNMETGEVMADRVEFFRNDVEKGEPALQ